MRPSIHLFGQEIYLETNRLQVEILPKDLVFLNICDSFVQVAHSLLMKRKSKIMYTNFYDNINTLIYKISVNQKLIIVYAYSLQYRAGEDLVKLYNSPEVQRFLNGLPMKELQSSKEIYQHGVLRKVYRSSIATTIQ